MNTIYWVASNSNFDKPLKMRDENQAVRLADSIKGGVYILYPGNQLILIYSYGERQAMGISTE